MKIDNSLKEFYKYIEDELNKNDKVEITEEILNKYGIVFVEI